MRFSFTPEQEEFRTGLRRALDARSSTKEVRRLMATETGFERAGWQKLNQELGLTAIHIPEAYGGQGFGYCELGIVLEEMGRALGFGHARIVLRHMVPNVLAPFLILLSAFVGQAILAEASLSYLGLGVQEPVAAWGLMLQGSAEDYATTAPWIAIFPGLAIVLTVLGASLFGDALRDAIDPKLRDR